MILRINLSSVSRPGREGRRFESYHPDKLDQGRHRKMATFFYLPESQDHLSDRGNQEKSKADSFALDEVWVSFPFEGSAELILPPRLDYQGVMKFILHNSFLFAYNFHKKESKCLVFARKQTYNLKPIRSVKRQLFPR